MAAKLLTMGGSSALLENNNTMLITGGGSGIGRGLAEAFDRAGNDGVIAGRQAAKLNEVVAVNPGIRSLAVDLADPAAIPPFAEEVVRRFPALNVLINNAGIMPLEDLTSAPTYLATAEAVIATNLLAPIRLTAALLPHLMAQPRAMIVNVSSDLAFVPMTAAPTYSAAKAAVHSYTMSLRHQLENTAVKVVELVPPYVQTGLMGPQHLTDPRAMPFGEFMAEALHILETEPDAPEIVVERCQPFRRAAEIGSFDEIFAGLNVTQKLG